MKTLSYWGFTPHPDVIPQELREKLTDSQLAVIEKARLARHTASDTRDRVLEKEYILSKAERTSISFSGKDPEGCKSLLFFAKLHLEEAKKENDLAQSVADKAIEEVKAIDVQLKIS